MLIELLLDFHMGYSFQKVKPENLSNNVEITEIQLATSFFLTKTHSLVQLLILVQSCQLKTITIIIGYYNFPKFTHMFIRIKEVIS